MKMPSFRRRMTISRAKGTALKSWKRQKPRAMASPDRANATGVRSLCGMPPGLLR